MSPSQLTYLLAMGSTLHAHAAPAIAGVMECVILAYACAQMVGLARGATKRQLYLRKLRHMRQMCAAVIAGQIVLVRMRNVSTGNVCVKKVGMVLGVTYQFEWWVRVKMVGMVLGVTHQFKRHTILNGGFV